ncbi:MAG: class I SAM-dependent methyltransferase [Candidatus Dormibacteraeota bacterium]|nr:class I SAM-dependent methyltransferase [Candidatus Dormibacteraeota bacterium]
MRYELKTADSSFVHEEPEGVVDLRATWESEAERWIRWAREPGHDSYWRFARDAFFELVPTPRRRTLDLGCGEGRLSRDLAARGHRVVSVDASPTLAKAAAAAAPDIPVLVADAVALPLAAGSFDLVVAYMSLHDMDGMATAVAEAARVMAPGGALCIAVVHPLNSAGCFAGLESNAPFVVEGSYMDAHPYVDEVERDGLAMRFSSNHHPLESYFRALENRGLLVQSLREVTEDEESTRAAARRHRWRRLPLFLFLRALKQ